MLRRDVAVAPAALVLSVVHADECESRAIGIGEREHGVAETLFPRLVPDAFFNKALGPIAERTQRHTERCLLRLADAYQALGRVLPREEGQHGTGTAGLVAIIEVIGPGVVEIDRAFDQAQSQDA